MKTIIAGSRHITDYTLVERAVKASGFSITEVISGHAFGVDMLGEKWADLHGIPKRQYPAIWRVNGKLDMKAGKKRNIKMAEISEALIAVWDQVSPGTAHMLNVARRKGLKVFVFIVKEK